MKITDKTVVQFHYTLKDESGKEIESSNGSDPLAYLHGYNNILVGVENALTDKEAGAKFSVTLQPEDTYGEIKENMVQRVPVKHLQGLPSKNAKWKTGMTAVVETEQGQCQVTVIKPGRFMVTVDLNPPLAGKVLTFDLEVIDVREATAEEIEHKHAHGAGGHHH